MHRATQQEIGISYVNLGQEVKVAEEAIGYDDGTNSTVAIAKPPATHLWMIYLGNRPPVKKHTIAVGAHFLRTELPNPPSIEFMVTWEVRSSSLHDQVDSSLTLSLSLSLALE